MTSNTTWRSELVWWLAISVATGAAFWIGAGPLAGVIAGGSMLALTAIVHFGRRRSDSLRVVGGAGDERTRDLYTRATAAAGSVLGLVVIGWWLIGVASGDPDPTLMVLAAVFGLSFLAAAAYHARQG